MEYVIYTFGGGEILWHVMNALALLFKTDSSYFTSVGMLTMAIGVFYATIRALGSNAISLFFKDWFLPTLLLSGLFFGLKSSVHIVDKVDPDFRYSKVDNIPIGIASIASLTSRIGEYLSETLETVLTTSDAERASRVGPMFATRLIQESSTLRIKDPLIRANVQDFMAQCFELPYIDSNIAPGRKAAETAKDILGFVKDNAHPMLGIYWRDPNGQTSFVSCKSCSEKIKGLISIEVNTGIKSLASSLFNSKADIYQTTTKLKKYGSSAWNSLAKGSSNISSIVQQQLMLNSYHKASHNRKDELDLGRYDAAVLHLEAERGQETQNITALVKSSMAMVQMPNLHSIILALALIFFAIIAPLIFLPKGISYLTMWVKIMVWVTTWPVLFTVINCIGHMFAARALNSTMLGLGDGLTLQTQTGLANVAYGAYCFVIGLQYAVAYFSWALISKAGGHAFSQLSSSFTESGNSFAGKAANEVVDGNVTFDSQTLHHRSVANSQIAQQQLGSSFNYGSRFDDGKVATIHGTSGTVVAQEHQSSFSTNLSQNDAFSQAMALQANREYRAAQDEGQRIEQSVSAGSQSLVSFAKGVAENKGINDTFGNTESVNLQKQMQDLMNLSDKIAEENNLNKQVAFDALVEGSFGGSFGVSTRGSLKGTAYEADVINKALSSDKGKQFSAGLNQAINYAKDHKASIGQSFNTNFLDQAQSHFSEAQSHANNRSSHLSEGQALSDTVNQSRQHGISSTSNHNEAVVSKIAEQFGGDKIAAAQHLAYHPNLGRTMSSHMIDGTARQSGPVGSREDINRFHAENTQRIGSAPTHNTDMEQMRAQHSLVDQEKQLDQKISGTRAQTEAELKMTNTTIDDQQAGLSEQHQTIQDRHKIEKQKTLVEKTISKADSNLEEFESYKTLKNWIGRGEKK